MHQDLIKLIEQAFSDVELSDGVSLREARVIDDHGSDDERKHARGKDELNDWQNISYTDIEKYPDIFCFLDAKGVLFHLPAYMVYFLKTHDQERSLSIEDTVVFCLTPSQEDKSWFSDRMCLFNTLQINAIVLFLEWKISNTEDLIDQEDFEKALEYWRKQKS